MQTINETAENMKNIMSVSLGEFSVGKVLSSIIIAVICILIIKLIMKFTNKLIEKSPFDKTLSSFVRSAIKISLYFIAILIVADSLGIPITSLIAVFSVIGLAVSLAVQDSLTNLAGGVSVLASKPFVNGDFVEIGGVSGKVKEIGLIYTKLTTSDNKIIFVPNSEVSSSKIVNFTSEDKRLLIINVTASYEAKIETVKKALGEAIDKTDGIIEREKVFTGVSEYGKSSIEYILKVWVETSDYWNVNFALKENIKHSFDENNIEMTYEHLNVHMMKN